MKGLNKQLVILLILVCFTGLIAGCSGDGDNQAIANQEEEELLKMDDVINCLKEENVKVKKLGVLERSGYDICYYKLNANIMLMMTDFGEEYSKDAEIREVTEWDTEAFQDGLEMFELKQNSSELLMTDLRAKNIVAHFEVVSGGELTDLEVTAAEDTAEKIKKVFQENFNHMKVSKLTGTAKNCKVEAELEYYQTELKEENQIFFDTYMSVVPKVTLTDEYLTAHPGADLTVKVENSSGLLNTEMTNPIQKETLLERTSFQDLLTESFTEAPKITVRVSAGGQTEEIILEEA